MTSATTTLAAQTPEPIIDVHLHANAQPTARPMCPGTGLSGATRADGSPACARPFESAATADQLRRDTLAAMERHNIVRAVVSGPALLTLEQLATLKQWKAEAPDQLILGLQTTGVDVDLDRVRSLIRTGTIAVIGEVGSQYLGLAPSDPKLEPLYALAEQEDIPVGIHVGGFGAPSPGFRASQGDPLLLEEVLARHPRLRLYVMHAGFPFLEQMVSLLRAHPQVYVDVSFISWSIPRPIFHEYLKRLVDYGFDKNIMFGTDQVSWPQAIDVAVESIRSATFLSEQQRRDIFYNNAARFLRLAGSSKP